jgi:hypothetical protein
MVRKIGLFAVLASGAAAVLVFVLLRPSTPPTSGAVADEAPASYTPGALADYVPADAAAVLSFDVKALRRSARLERWLGGLLLRHQVDMPWVGLACIDPWEQIDHVRVVLPAGDPARPLWLVAGRIDPDRLQIGPGRLVLRTEGPHRLYEFHDPIVGPTFLAIAGDTLVVSASKARLEQALKYATRPNLLGRIITAVGVSGPTAPHAVSAALLAVVNPLALVEVRDPTLGELLLKVDRTRPVWLAVSVGALGPVQKLDNRAAELILQPILKRSRSIEGGLEFGDDLRAELTFRAADAGSAEQLEQVLASVVAIAQGAPLLRGIERDLVPIFALLGSGQTSRDDDAVTLRCRLAAEQLP